MELKSGQVLFEQGTLGDCIYVVSSGEVEIVRELSSGGEELLKVAGPGDYFGGNGTGVRAAPPLGDSPGENRRDGGRLHGAGVPGKKAGRHRISGDRRAQRAGRLVPPRHQTQQQIRADPVHTVVAPPQRPRDAGHTDVVDGGDRAAKQDRPT